VNQMLCSFCKIGASISESARTVSGWSPWSKRMAKLCRKCVNGRVCGLKGMSHRDLLLLQWRQGWDFDSLCAASAPSPSNSSGSQNDRFWQKRHGSTGGTSTASSSQVATPTDVVDPLICRAKGRLMFYEGLSSPMAASCRGH
jgi:hypothetical protein